MPHPGRWAGADEQARPAVACKAPRGWWVGPFPAGEVVALKPPQMDDVVQAVLCLAYGLFPLLETHGERICLGGTRLLLFALLGGLP